MAPFDCSGLGENYSSLVQPCAVDRNGERRKKGTNMYKTPPRPPGSREMHPRLRRNLPIIFQIRIILDRRPAGGGRGGGVDVVDAEGGEGVDEGGGVREEWNVDFPVVGSVVVMWFVGAG